MSKPKMPKPRAAAPKKRGRPASANFWTSANANYEALAWEVDTRLREAEQGGLKLKIKSTVRQIMLESVQRRNDYIMQESVEQRNDDPKKIVRLGLVDEKLSTAYTEVRKILKKYYGR